jgi:leukotriene-A4 hydrolase
VDFTRRIVYGFTDYTVQVHVSNTPKILLDFRGVSIEKVVLLTKEKESPLAFTIPQFHKNLGHCLQVSIPKELQSANSSFVFRVYSSSTDLSGGIQWFEACQTQGKKFPFMYTQFEAILARTMIPIQDTPSVKAPYDMKVTVPAPLVAACSGALVNTEECTKNLFPFPEPLKFLTYHYQQKMPIPSYLIAVAVGALERGQIGPRSYVWCEKEIMEAAKKEWSDTEKFLQAGEKSVVFLMNGVLMIY